jgi:cytochrome c biogenesis protein CcmG/thiol:disulfide interchange protein DsbE
MAARVQRRGIRVIGIDQQEDAGQVARFSKQFALPFTVYIDRTGVTHDVLGAHMIPATIYVDARGVIKWQHLGPLTEQDWKDLAVLTRSAG